MKTALAIAQRPSAWPVSLRIWRPISRIWAAHIQDVGCPYRGYGHILDMHIQDMAAISGDVGPISWIWPYPGYTYPGYTTFSRRRGCRRRPRRRLRRPRSPGLLPGHRLPPDLQDNHPATHQLCKSVSPDLDLAICNRLREHGRPMAGRFPCSPSASDVPSSSLKSQQQNMQRKAFTSPQRLSMGQHQHTRNTRMQA